MKSDTFITHLLLLPLGERLALIEQFLLGDIEMPLFDAHLNKKK
jgi:hypothetical protein